MSSSESDIELLKRKKRDRSKSNEKRGKDKIRSRDKKRRRTSRSRSRHEKKKKHSNSRSSSISSHRKSRKHKKHNKLKEKLDNEIKLKQERRRRKYDNEIDELKGREIDKRREVEEKRKQDEKEKQEEEKKQLEKIKKMKERELTEEEKLEIKKKARLAKAKLMVMIEREEEKKIEETTNENDQLMEDFLIPRENIVEDNDNIVEENKILPRLPIEFTEINKKEETKIIDEEDDPLDAYMKTIQCDTNLQDYQISQMFFNMQLQRRYDEIAGNDLEEKQDSVVMVEDTERNVIDKTKIITLDDILDNIENNDDNCDEEEFHKKFIESLKGVKAPDIDPLYGYSEEKKDIVIYSEDANEYLKEEDLVFQEDTWQKVKKMSERKELKLVNHAEINYDSFRKNLYRESKDISIMTKEKVEHIRKQMGDIKVRGKNVPKPILNWFQCGLSDRILAVLERRAIKSPFPIQSQAIPAIMSGRDVIGIAETGSGKTLAFVLPMLRHILDQRSLNDGEGPISLIMAPTRELAYQIFVETRSFSKVLGLKCVCVYGGAGLGGQLSELRRGAEIVVCTPGRMIDVLCLSNGKITNLRRITYVVIDEADRMFDLGFEPQISRILANIRPDRQTVMFSATFPRQIESLAKKILNSPIEIIIGARGQSNSNVEQHVEIIEESKKLFRLLEILGIYSVKDIGIIIFVDKQEEADELYKELYKLGYLCLMIHGGQDQEDRDFSIQDFKNSVRNILISTSVCARGLDVKHCGLVINFKCPNHLEDYIHRVGRTGRAGNKGLAYTFITPDEEHLAEDILRVLEKSNQELPDELKALVRNYKEKLQNGEADKFKRSGYLTKGYRFDTTEKEKEISKKKQLGKGYGLEESDDEDLIQIKGKKEGEENKENPQAIALIKTKKEEEKKKTVFKDPRAKQIAIDVGMNAAKNAIIAGKTEEEALAIAQEAIEKVMAEYKPSVSAEKGVELAAKIIEEWVERENERNNIFTCELEINDYPSTARSKVMYKEFLNSIYEMTGCNVVVRGQYTEAGKKPPLGLKKLHLYIQGNTKTEVLSAYREIKKMLDETALAYYTMGNSALRYQGKYQI